MDNIIETKSFDFAVRIVNLYKHLLEDKKERIYHKFIDVERNEKGTPTSIKFKNTDKNL